MHSLFVKFCIGRPWVSSKPRTLKTKAGLAWLVNRSDQKVCIHNSVAKAGGHSCFLAFANVWQN